MFMHHADEVSGQLDEEFTKPVESIMRCEDFKSNFARKLSNRYISRSPTKRQNSLKLRTFHNEKVDNAPERIERCSQLSKVRTMEQNGEVVKPPDKLLKNHNIRDTQVSALNMEIETLRWQLSQTESNRQMHIALLKQVVTFLSRVKEHIEYQSPETESNKEVICSREALCNAINVADLPRSRSVLHVNKHEYSLSPSKKLGTKKISKSISNVNGYRDCHGVWNQPKLSLTADTDSAQKITEEITRLITLANTVLSTKLPDLACTCSVDSNLDTLQDTNICGNDIIEKNDSNTSLSFSDEDTTNAFILNTIYDSEDTFNDLTNKFDHAKEETLSDFIVTSSPITCDLENHFANLNINEINGSIHTEIESKTSAIEKRSEYNHVANFIEDESGFSSMSSFQEIGIPIISIIPPSPCKEVGYIDELTDILDESEKWKSDAMELDKQTVKVFWV